ncbi:sodium- and chloride-dependent GABA transporter 1-like isoform X2 [Pollicipes pollicipes]|uniref:sodium- and chloride-dependent GABA transporter 1-like isoform X2 n=1 Tax=Pollicipes pollicipes TaxID=41117 RepID=UPI0018859B16|nr:sodium- and chloride-dependent GABA transporter 1-like isoform X2 [Pollicipes pollicipes]
MTVKLPRGCCSGGQDENTERGNWGGKWDYMLSLAGYAIGIGNVWRFPYLCYRNGGGAFLIPYFTMLFLCGIPLFLMETCIGQFSSSGCLTVFKISRIFKGAGFASCLVTFVVSGYYNVIITYPVYYMFLSFTPNLPWMDCNNTWNTPLCENLRGGDTNRSAVSNLTSDTIRRTPTDEFFHNYMLQITDSVEDQGTVVWQLALCSCLCWLVVYFCIFRGVKLVGKVVYFTATFPFIMLFVLFVRGVTLPGAADGIKFYLTPDFNRLTEFKVWADAAVQIFYSLGPGWGGLIMMSSFNRFRNNVKFDAIVVPTLNCFTSFFAGFVVFSVLGFMSHQTGVPIEKVATGGPSLAFVTYPEALAMLPAAPFWAVLFFFMLFLLGIDSEFVQIETVVSSLLDEFPQHRHRKPLITLVLCMLMSLISLACVTQGGMYVLQILDWYCASMSVILVCICECIAFAWIYGPGKFVRDVEFMAQRPIGTWWRLCWNFITPIVLILIFITTLVFNTPVNYRDVEFPAWAQGVGWLSALASLLMMPGYAVYLLAVTPGTLAERLKICSQPTDDWGPALDAHRTEWEEYKAKHPPHLLPPGPLCDNRLVNRLRRRTNRAEYNMAAQQPPASNNI